MSDGPQRIGSYPIERELGRGGMGIVYLARDPRLQRLVAIKVLPDAFARDPERLARFEREARLLASLNHPNIAAIHGLEEDGGHSYLILEYVEGETLAQHLGRGALPIDESLDACRQVAAALEAAHENGVIHRDLKPGNVKRTPGGEIKVLDFGLAKGAASESNPDMSHSPTIAYNMTGAGVILGTAAYMSPEQARGKPVDRRTDIWSFGCLLYECLTGRQLFQGETVSDLIAKILEREPDWSALPAQTPDKVRELLRKMLEKDAKKRLRDIGDARIELEDALAARVSSGRIQVTGGAAGSAGAARAKMSMATIATVAGVTAAVTAAITIFLHGMMHQPAVWAPTRFSITAPPGTKLDEDAVQVALSPDGRMVAFTATDSGGTSQIYVRPLDTLAARAIPGTDNATALFWSPDSRSLGFFADGKLKKAPLTGGEVEPLANASNGRGGTWNRSNVIVYAPEGGGPLYRISANGGEPQQITTLDSTRHETAHRFPWFLPDGKHFLYVSLPSTAGKHDVWVGSLDSPKRVRVLGAEEAPVYAAPGYLIYPRGRGMVAQRFDAGALSVRGEPIALPDQPGVAQATGFRAVSAAENGTLAFLNGRVVATKLVWIDRSGRQIGSLGLQPANYQWVALSPDGRNAVIVRLDSPGQANLWMVDLQSSVPTRFTFGNTLDGTPLFSPDGSRLIYQSNPKGRFDLFVKGITASTPESALVTSDVNFKEGGAVTTDGRLLLFAQLDSRTGWDLMELPLDGSGQPRPLVRTPFNERWCSLSPDGRWIAYTSDESGRLEIYVRGFPGLGSKARVSTTGGAFPQWRNDGKEILFYALDFQTVMSADTQTSPAFHASAPHLLFKFPPGTTPPGVSPDFQRFLAPVPAGDNGSASVSVVLDWQAGLPKH